MGEEDTEHIAYAQKELLKEDLSLRVSSAINWVAALFRELKEAKTKVVNDFPEEKELLNLKKDLLRTTGTHRDMIKTKVAELEQRKANVQTVTRKIVNQKIYLECLEYFCQLWLNTKDQLAEEHWTRKTTKKRLGLKEELDLLFDPNVSIENEPSVMYALFKEYLSTLAAAGILDFKTKKFKAGRGVNG